MNSSGDFRPCQSGPLVRENKWVIETPPAQQGNQALAKLHVRSYVPRLGAILYLVRTSGLAQPTQTAIRADSITGGGRK
jgi:hypothetical protein